MHRNVRTLIAVASAVSALAGAVPATAADYDATALLEKVGALQSKIFADFSMAGSRRAPVVAPPVGKPVPAIPRKPHAPAGPSDPAPGSPGQPGPAQPPAPGQARPDFSFTTGRLCSANDPDFKEFRGPERFAVCNRNVTEEMKQQVAAHYGIPQGEWRNYEFDHLIPLEIGGDSYIDNLWPQPIAQAKVKDQLENELGSKLLAGTMTQADAVKQIYAWFGVAETSMPQPSTLPHAP